MCIYADELKTAKSVIISLTMASNESEPQPNPAALEAQVATIFAGVNFFADSGFEGRKIRRKGWNPSGDHSHVAILREEVWSGMGPGMPSNVLALSTQKVQDDGICDVNEVTIETFGELGQQITARNIFRLAEQDFEERVPVTEAELDEYFAEQEMERLATNPTEARAAMLRRLKTFDPLYAFDIMPL
jgi:hypothetical protein